MFFFLFHMQNFKTSECLFFSTNVLHLAQKKFTWKFHFYQRCNFFLMFNDFFDIILFSLLDFKLYFVILKFNHSEDFGFYPFYMIRNQVIKKKNDNCPLKRSPNLGTILFLTECQKKILINPLTLHSPKVNSINNLIIIITRSDQAASQTCYRNTLSESDDDEESEHSNTYPDYPAAPQYNYGSNPVVNTQQIGWTFSPNQWQ
jgi:hypothetical protein